MEYYSPIKRNAFESVLMKWMNLEPIIQSEVSLKERKILYFNTYIWKIVLKNLFTGQQWRNRHREQIYGCGERGGEVEMYGNSNMETYVTISKIDSQGEFAVWLRKLKHGLCINLEGVGWGGTWEVQKGGDICILIADSC